MSPLAEGHPRPEVRGLGELRRVIHCGRNWTRNGRWSDYKQNTHPIGFLRMDLPEMTDNQWYISRRAFKNRNHGCMQTAAWMVSKHDALLLLHTLAAEQLLLEMHKKYVDWTISKELLLLQFHLLVFSKQTRLSLFAISGNEFRAFQVYGVSYINFLPP